MGRALTSGRVLRLPRPTRQLPRTAGLEGGNNCIEIAATGSTAALRESETPANVVSTNRAALSTLVLGIKAGNVRVPRP
ncbi:DUF397 domain-containing protein [Streptomyces varsoviensis]|uniref:DUF397 domain-containing protein n=1 Tax=Streptomyces varsoviensis TaxID=67373 RepID=UPI000B10ED12|nr:DUF397 domain-containing protein [Streptomyces varsoviensis]